MIFFFFTTYLVLLHKITVNALRSTHVKKKDTKKPTSQKKIQEIYLYTNMNEQFINILISFHVVSSFFLLLLFSVHSFFFSSPSIRFSFTQTFIITKRCVLSKYRRPALHYMNLMRNGHDRIMKEEHVLQMVIVLMINAIWWRTVDWLLFRFFSLFCCFLFFFFFISYEINSINQTTPIDGWMGKWMEMKLNGQHSVSKWPFVITYYHKEWLLLFDFILYFLFYFHFQTERKNKTIQFRCLSSTHYHWRLSVVWLKEI